MSGLFYDEPTVQLRRSSNNPSLIEQVDKTSQVDVFGDGRLIENIEIYGSPLLNAATELLGILVTLPRQREARDIDCFRQKLLDALSVFRQQGQYLDYHPNIIEKSCFVFCAVFDEIIMYTPWGEHSGWENHSLLSKVFLQRNGGEVFFVLLDKACQQPNKLVDFIELQYVLLMLGFKGRYRHGDENELHQIKSNAYSLIRRCRKDNELLIPKTPTLIERQQPWHILSLGKMLAILMFIIVCASGASEYWYSNRSQQILAQFDSITLSDVAISNAGADLVYLSTDIDIALQTPVVTDVVLPDVVEAKYWDLILATFKNSLDAERLLTSLGKSGYEPLTRESKGTTELYIRSNENVQDINKLKNELNVRFGLNATIKRAYK